MNNAYHIYNNNGNKKIVLSLENNFPIKENSDNSNISNILLNDGELESTNKDAIDHNADYDSSDDTY